jgi:hypothetical protein
MVMAGLVPAIPINGHGRAVRELGQQLVIGVQAAA